MDSQSIATAAYIVAALLFIFSLAGLSKHETSRQGVVFGIAGMTIALAATFGLVADIGDGTTVVAAAGRRGHRRRDRAVARPRGRDDRHARAHRAAALVRRPRRRAGRLERLPEHNDFTCSSLEDIHNAEVFIGVFIGAVTFTGSIVAFLKLSARIKSAR